MAVLDFLSADDVLFIHAKQISLYDGDPGLRDRGLLESAVSQPSAGFGGTYLHDDIYLMAAAYLYHLVQNHPFVDGNKRAGAASALAFLELNDIAIDNRVGELYELTLATAQGQRTKEQIAVFFRERAIEA